MKRCKQHGVPVVSSSFTPALRGDLRMLVGALPLLMACRIALAQTVIDNGSTEIVPGTQADPWVISNGLIVGDMGSGTLNILSGGTVQSTLFSSNTSIGQRGGSVGTVTVDGTGALLEVLTQSINFDDHAFHVGNEGQGALTITNGGVVRYVLDRVINTDSGDLLDDLIIGTRVGSTGIVTVDGPGSLLEIVNNDPIGNATFVLVGHEGQGTLAVTNGGVVRGSETVSMVIGAQGGSSGEVRVDGAGSFVDLRAIHLGGPNLQGGGQGRLEITSGGAVAAESVAVGSDSVVIVDGAGLRADGDMVVAGTLTVSGGGAVSGDQNVVDTGGVATVEGAGSEWTGSGIIVQGSFAINGGALVSISAGTVADGGTATVDGSGSRWENDFLQVASSFVTPSPLTPTLIIRNGASVASTAQGVLLGGGVVVDGVGSRWDMETLVAASGLDGKQGTFSVVNGGIAMATAFSEVISLEAASVNVEVDGVGSRLDLADAMLGAEAGGQTTLAITNGGVATAGMGTIGVGGTGSTHVEVADVGSRWNIAQDLMVQGEGQDTLAINRGGAVAINGDGQFGLSEVGTAFVEVGGMQSQLSVADDLLLGVGGSGTLIITNQGQVTADEASLGVAGAGRGMVMVDGSGSRWDVTSALTVGDAGQGTLTLAREGRVTSPGLFIATQAGSTGTLNIGAAAGAAAIAPGILDAAAITFGVGASRIVFNHTDVSGQYLFLPVISGPGSVHVEAGTTVLTGNSTFTGGTVIAGGLLQVGDGGTTGAIGSGGVLNAGTLAFNRSNVYQFDSVIAGTGAVQQIGPGTTVLTADSTYTGGTLIAAGTLQLGNGGTAGAVVGDVLNDGTLTFNRSNAYQFDGVIAGSGAVQQIGPGTTVLTADSTYTGGTLIAAGTLQIGNGGTAGAVVGDVLNDGTLTFNRSNAYQFDGVIAGSGAVQQIGPGTTVLTADSTYTGGTLIAAGTLSVSADANLGDLSGEVILDGGTLRLSTTFDSSRAVRLNGDGGTFEVLDRNKLSGEWMGVGDLIKTGSGTLINNGHASYTGSTQVAQGTLVVGDSAHPNAELGGGGDIMVAIGAAFGGYGTAVGAVENRGTLGVGNALPALATEPDAQFTIIGSLRNIGTTTLVNGAAADQLIVSGSYISSGGRLEMEAVLDEGGTAAQSDRLRADTVIREGAPTGVVVHSAGGSGAVTEGDGIPLVEVVDPAQSAAGAFVLAQRVVAGPYEYLLMQGGVADPGDGAWYLRSEAPLQPQPTQPELVPIFRPEIGAYLGSRQAATSILVHTLHDRLGEPQFAETFAGEAGYLGSVWMRVLGAETQSEAGEGLIDAEGGQSLFQAGAEVAQWSVFSDRDRLHLGGMLGYSRSETRVSVRFNPARARGETEGTLAGGYATWFANDENRLGAYVDAWAQYGWFDSQVMGEGLAPVNYDADAWSASLEFGYAVGVGNWVIEPEVQALYITYTSDVVVDSNGTRVASLDDDDTLSRVGARLYPQQELAHDMRPFIEANWWHGNGTPSFAFNGQRVESAVPHDRYELKVGLQGAISDRFMLWTQLAGEWGSGAYKKVQGQIGLKYSW